MTGSPDATSPPQVPPERDRRLIDVAAAGARLMADMDELGLSLAAAYLSMSLEMLAIDERRRSDSH